MLMKKFSVVYSEVLIKVFKGFELVKQWFGMYICIENLLYIIQEVIDNVFDEVFGGYGKQIMVMLYVDQLVLVEDDGCGILFGMYFEEGVLVVEIVFMCLYVGGKFDKVVGGVYMFLGGLYGVGVLVMNVFVM